MTAPYSPPFGAPASPGRDGSAGRAWSGTRVWASAAAVATLAVGAGLGLTAVLSHGDTTSAPTPLHESASPSAEPPRTSGSTGFPGTVFLADPIEYPAAVETLGSDGLSLPGSVSVDPELPGALPLPDGIWAKTGPGWVLASYRPSIAAGPANSLPDMSHVGRQVVYLIAPDSTRYQVLELDTEVPLRIDSWSGGDTVAYVRECEVETCSWPIGPTLLLDLTTGEISAVQGVDDADYIVATLPGSRRLWTNDDSEEGATEQDGVHTRFGVAWKPTSASPTGEYATLSRRGAQTASFSPFHFAVASTATAAVTEFPGLNPASVCDPAWWTDETHVMVLCITTDYDEEYFVADAVAGTVETTGDPTPKRGSAWVAPENWVDSMTYVGQYFGATTAYTWTPTPRAGISQSGEAIEITFLDPDGTPLTYAIIEDVVGRAVYASGATASSDVGEPEIVVSCDLSTGRELVLVPEPPGGPAGTTEAGDDAYITGVTSWVVAP